MRNKPALLFLVLLFAALLPFAWRIARPFVTPFLVAAVLATVVYPVYERLERRLRRPAVAALAVTLASLALLAGLMTLAGFTLAREVSEAYGALSRLSVEEGGWPALAAHTSDRVLDAVASRIPIDKPAIQNEVRGRIQSAGAVVLKSAGTAVAGLTSGIVIVIFAAVFLYFLLQHGTLWISRLESIVPLEPATTRHLLVTLRGSVVANVNGVLAVVLSQGALLSLAFWVAGLRAPVLWGAIGGLASIIPVVGAIVVWAPVALGFLVMKAYLKAILLALWCAVVVGSADNIIRPYVVSGGIRQHPLLVALSMLGGAQAFGAAGVLVGPVILALVLAVVSELQRLSAGTEATPSGT